MNIEIPDSAIKDYLMALDKAHDVDISSLKPKERIAVSNNLSQKRSILENLFYKKIIKSKKEDDTCSTEYYEVWVTLEKWDGDDKIEDIQTTKIFENSSEENAELIWSLCESVSIAAKDTVDGLFYS